APPPPPHAPLPILGEGVVADPVPLVGGAPRDRQHARNSQLLADDEERRPDRALTEGVEHPWGHFARGPVVEAEGHLAAHVAPPAVTIPRSRRSATSPACARTA